MHETVGHTMTGMVLAAGEGKRMRPLTLEKPKPLIQISGKTLLDYALDAYAKAGTRSLVVNAHYLGDQIEAHCKSRTDLSIQVSHEVEKLETGGGVRQALPLLGENPFFVTNGDSLIFDGPELALSRLKRMFDPAVMDALLLVHPISKAHGYQGQGDFFMDQAGRLSRRGRAGVAPFVFTGTQVLSPSLFSNTPPPPWSLNHVYDRALAQNRLFGLAHDGDWFHVSTPTDIAPTEEAINSDFLNLFC